MRVRGAKPAQRIANVYVVRLDAVSLIAALEFFAALLDLLRRVSLSI